MIEELKPSWAKPWNPPSMEEPPEPVRDPHPGVYHDCPTCGYRVTDLEMMSVRFDYGCPRCGNSFKNFVPKRLEATK